MWCAAGEAAKVHAARRSCILVFLSPSRDRRHPQPLFEWRNGDTRCIEWMCWVTDRAVNRTWCSFSVPGEGPLLPVESNYCFCKNFLTVVKTWSVDAELGRLYAHCAKNISDRLFGFWKNPESTRRWWSLQTSILLTALVTGSRDILDTGAWIIDRPWLQFATSEL